MKNTVVIHQPDFAPYIGFFQRLISDLFIILDNVISNDGWLIEIKFERERDQNDNK